MPSIFLSHSSKDKFFARKLAEKLTASGVAVWIDEAELRVGDSLIAQISSAIEQADFVVAVLSHNSVQSNWVQHELRQAMNEEINGRRVKVLPVLIERCEIPEYLRDKVYADFTDADDFDTPVERLLRAVGVARATAAAAASGPPVGPKGTPQEAGGLEAFDDIRIVAIDKSLANRPDPEKLLYRIYLELSGHPPQEWTQIFDAERQFPRHTMWRHAWVEGQYIVIHCVPDEIKKYHLADLKQDVANSNAKYREYLRTAAAQRARAEAHEREQQQQLDRALDDVDL